MNDVGEREVKLVLDFGEKFIKDEEPKQFLLQVTENNTQLVRKSQRFEWGIFLYTAKISSVAIHVLVSW